MIIVTSLLSQMMLFFSSSQADCNNDITTFGDNLFVLSDEQSDADAARSVCTASGGKLAEVGDGEVKDDLIEFMERKYEPGWLVGCVNCLEEAKCTELSPSKDLETVTVYLNPDHRAVARYNFSGGSMDTRSPSWLTPDVGQVRSFKVYREATENFSTKIKFCYLQSGGVRGNFTIVGGCINPWLKNFEAFASTKKVESSFLLIRQEFKAIEASVLGTRVIFSVESIPESFKEHKSGDPTSFYIPEASVYIGARSDMNESKYSWSNGTDITNAASSNGSVCQQMTWPLTYDDGRKLSSKECSEQAYYVCQYQVSFSVAPLECNGSSLLISWNTFNLAALSSPLDDLTLQINSTGNYMVSITRPFQSSQLALSGLKKRTNYSLLVSLKDRNCTTSIYRTSLFATTSYGLPDEVKRAYVEISTLSTDGCNLAWEYDPFDKNITKFKITGNDEVVWEFLRDDLNASSNLTTHLIDLSMFESQTTVQFKIQAVSCDGDSEAMIVEGSCQAPLKLPDNGGALGSNGTSIGIALGVICIIMLLVAGLVLWRRRKTRKEINSLASKEQTQPSFKNSEPDETPPSTVTAEPYIQRENFIHEVQVVQASEVPPQVLQEDAQMIEDNIYEKVQPSFKNSEPDETPPSTVTAEPYIQRENSIHEMQVVQASEVPPQVLQEDAQMIEDNIYGNALGNVPSKLLQANDLEAFYVSECQNQFKSMKSEFKAIVDYSNHSEKPHEEAKKSENKKLNRYKNIYPYDHSLVILGSGRYINASVLQKHANGKSFIATQGPKPSTSKDFWEMVWDQNSSILVMLCNCMEVAKVKCDQYWPDLGMTKVTGSYKIQNILEKNLGATVKRTLLLTNLDIEEERTIFQFHFIAWPDHGIPLTTTGVKSLRKIVNEQARKQQTEAPIVIHCSAGAGRTGTYIAFDNCAEELEVTGKVDIANAVVTMRENRKDMVQTQKQYLMIYKLVVESLILPDTDVSLEEFERIVLKKEWELRATKEFNYLSKKAIASSLQKTYKPDSENEYLNENPSDGDVNQVKVRSSDEYQVAVDAHYIGNHYYSGSIIASSSKEGSQGSFWKTIACNNVRIVIALESLDHDDIQRTQEELTVDNLVVTVDHVDQGDLYVERSLTVTDVEGAQKPLHVKHIALNCWEQASSNVTTLVEINSKIKESMSTELGSNAVVYCNNGCDKTGVFLALSQIIEEFVLGNIDILRTVKDLRDMRSGMISSMELYKLCYILTKDYEAILRDADANQPYDICL